MFIIFGSLFDVSSGSVADVVSVGVVGIDDGVGDMWFVLDWVHGFDGCEILKYYFVLCCCSMGSSVSVGFV